jgi:hypothetical protein
MHLPMTHSQLKIKVALYFTINSQFEFQLTSNEKFQ